MSTFPTAGTWHWYWRVEDGKPNCGIFAELRPGHAYAVARCPQYQTKEQWEADAKLMTASPKMLEVLELVVGSMKYDKEDATSQEVMRRVNNVIELARKGGS